jgi:hypothetical protein
MSAIDKLKEELRALDCLQPRELTEYGIPARISLLQVAAQVAIATQLERIADSLCSGERGPGGTLDLVCKCGWAGQSDECQYDSVCEEYLCPDCGSGAGWLKAV